MTFGRRGKPHPPITQACTAGWWCVHEASDLHWPPALRGGDNRRRGTSCQIDGSPSVLCESDVSYRSGGACPAKFPSHRPQRSRSPQPSITRPELCVAQLKNPFHRRLSDSRSARQNQQLMQRSPSLLARSSPGKLLSRDFMLKISRLLRSQSSRCPFKHIDRRENGGRLERLPDR